MEFGPSFVIGLDRQFEDSVCDAMLHGTPRQHHPTIRLPTAPVRVVESSSNWCGPQFPSREPDRKSFAFARPSVRPLDETRELINVKLIRTAIPDTTARSRRLYAVSYTHLTLPRNR